MTTVAIESPKQDEVICLLNQSVKYIRSLYPEEHKHSFKMSELTRSRSRFFVVRDQTMAAIGIAAYVGHGRKVVELKHMFIDPLYRGLGIGRTLLASVEQCAILHRQRKIVLETSFKQSDAVRLYRSCGYVPCAPYTDHHIHDIFLEKVLNY